MNQDMKIESTLESIRSNDPRLTELIIHPDIWLERASLLHPKVTVFSIQEAFWKELGQCVGRNTSLEKVCVSFFPIVDDHGEVEIEHAHFSLERLVVSLCNGLKHNRCIKNLSLQHCPFSLAGTLKVLKPFFEENHNLLEIDLEWSLLGLEGIELFSRILQRRTRKNLEVLKIKGRNILVQTNNVSCRRRR